VKGGGTMGKKILILSCTFSIIGLFFADLSHSGPKVTEVKIGAVLSMTGKGSFAGQTLLQGAELAIDEINAAGGIKSLGGAKLRFIKADSKTDPKTAGMVTESLIIRDKVNIIWGEYTTGATLVVQDVCEKYKVPILSVAGSPIITGRGLKWAFRTHPHLVYWHEVAFDMFKKIGVKNAVILTDSGAYGQANKKVYGKFCEKTGVKVLLDEVYDMGALDLSAFLIKAGAAKPDALLSAPYLGDAMLMVRQARENDIYFPLIIGMATGFSDVQFRKKAGSAGDYIMDAFLYHESMPGQENKKFVKAFKGRYSLPPDVHNEWGYTDMYVIADALERAASTEREAIQSALRGTNMRAPSGLIKFGQDGQNHEFKGIVIQWLNGKAEVIWPKNVATSKMVYPIPKWEKRR
jgi:branched-chain amino acid transport system substrate-binding protein